MEHPSGTDTRTETTDKPTQSERPYTPPPDNPGSPGQPSRLQDRARAREQAQQPKPTVRDDKPTASQTESGRNVDERSRPESPNQEKDEGRPLPRQQEARPDTTPDDPSPGDREAQAEAEVTDLSDERDELTDTVDRPDFQDPQGDPRVVPDRYGTPLEQRDGTRTPLFDGEPKREQAEQGALGDCGIIATLGAVAGHHPEVLRDCIRETDDGNYHVSLHEARYSAANRRYEPTGRPVTLTVTPDLPVFDQRPGQPAFADSESTGAAWAPVLEKAIAGTDQTWNNDRQNKAAKIWKAQGNLGEPPTGYVRLHQGSHAGDRAELLTQLTGRPAKVAEYPAGHDDQGRDADRRLHDEIADRLVGNKPVLVGTRELDQSELVLPKNLVDSHVYEVTKVDDQGRLHLRNPWNRKHPEPMTVQDLKANTLPYYTTLE